MPRSPADYLTIPQQSEFVQLVSMFAPFFQQYSTHISAFLHCSTLSRPVINFYSEQIFSCKIATKSSVYFISYHLSPDTPEISHMGKPAQVVHWFPLLMVLIVTFNDSLTSHPGRISRRKQWISQPIRYQVLKLKNHY